VQSFFPNGIWLNPDNFTEVFTINDTSGGSWLTLPAKFDMFGSTNSLIRKHILPGKIYAQ